MSDAARTLLAIAIVAALIVVLGWADDKASPGSQGRGQVSAPATTP